MGDATAAAAAGVRNVVRNPVVVGVTAAVLVALVPVAGALGLLGLGLTLIVVGPLVLKLLGGVVLKPLLFGGIAGVADAGFDGETGVAAYTGTLSEHYLSLAGAYGLYEVVVLVTGVALGVVVGLVAWATSSLGGAAIDGELLAIVAAGLGGLVLAALAVAFQFVDVAVVVGGVGALDAVRTSVRLTVEDPLGVLWYTAVRLLLAGVVVLPGAVIGLVAGRVDPRLAYAGLAVGALLLPVAVAAVTATHVAYYRRRRPVE